jgi:hypothetical protein
VKSTLLRELLAARKTASTTDLAAALQACGLPVTTVWGVAFVEIDGNHYVPVVGGKPAVIVPLFVDGVLLDLVATGLQTRATRTRAGIATVLGQEWIDHAKATETPLRLFGDPIEWLRNGGRGAVVVDWRAARHVLADVPGIACETEFLAAQVERAMRQPVHIPRLFVREGKTHAAA